MIKESISCEITWNKNGIRSWAFDFTVFIIKSSFIKSLKGNKQP